VEPPGAREARASLGGQLKHAAPSGQSRSQPCGGSAGEVERSIEPDDDAMFDVMQIVGVGAGATRWPLTNRDKLRPMPIVRCCDTSGK
jgi:hypothetical protein